MEEDKTVNRLDALNLILAEGAMNLANKNERKENEKLEGYNELIQLRAKATEFRQGYLNWRSRKPHGARGDICDVFLDCEKIKKNENLVHLPQINFDEILKNLIRFREDQKIEKLKNKTSNECFKEKTEKTNKRLNESQISSDETKVKAVKEKIPLRARAVSSYGTADDVSEESELLKQVKKEVLHAQKKLFKDDTRIRPGATCQAEWLRFYYNPLTPFDSFTYNKLNQNSLKKLKGKVKVPVYTRDISKVENWILHVGVGGFHRSHQAVFLDDLLTAMHLQKHKSVEKTKSQHKGNTTESRGCALGSAYTAASSSPAFPHHHDLPFQATAAPSHPPIIRHLNSFNTSSTATADKDLSSSYSVCTTPPHHSFARSTECKIDEGSWALCGIGLMTFDKKMYEVLKQQDMLYTVLTRSSVSSEARVIGSVMDYIYAPEEQERLIAKLKDEKTKIVSLTVTEKGYCQDTHGNLDFNNQHIQHDLKNLYNPQTVVGLLVLGLMLRKKENIHPFTVLSCDNLPDNGNVICKMVLQFAQNIDKDLAIWIRNYVSFPNTMVDRITPITGEEHKQLLKKDFGIDDGWPVVAEEFRQWVIENKFCNSRPAFERVGALVVEDVRSYEIMKLRLLNGGHTAIAYISYLAGYRFVDDAVTDVLISSFLRAYMDEVSSTVKDVSVELERYKEQIVERFGNRFIKDNLMRIAEDGSTKFYNIMKDTIKELHSESRHIHQIAFGFACWIRYMTGTDEEGEPIAIKDDRADILMKSAQKVFADCTNSENIREYVKQVFGDDLIGNEMFINELRICLSAIKLRGVKSVIKSGCPLRALLQDFIADAKKADQLLKFSGVFN